MNLDELKKVLQSLESGEISWNEAYDKIKYQPYEDLGFAKIDYERNIRQGAAEVVYGEGKTKEQILEIVKHMLDKGEKSVLITRLSKESCDYIKGYLPVFYDEISRICIAGEKTSVNGKTGKIVVVTGGTSDIPVAQEVVLTARFYGNNVVSLYDVGVAGVHRLLDNAQVLSDARVVIAVAGMEGALASVVGGLVDCPVIAVPTSVGYGASFGGLSALLSMLNSCASGVSVVNIDNGFGAGYLAGMINKM